MQEGEKNQFLKSHFLVGQCINFLTFRNSMNDPRYSTTSASSGPEIIDPRAKQNEQRQKIEQEMSSSELVKQARLMGFEDKTILAALRW